jgi:hypothetical protein
MPPIILQVKDKIKGKIQLNIPLKMQPFMAFDSAADRCVQPLLPPRLNFIPLGCQVFAKHFGQVHADGEIAINRVLEMNPEVLVVLKEPPHDVHVVSELAGLPPKRGPPVLLVVEDAINLRRVAEEVVLDPVFLEVKVFHFPQ